MLPCQPCARQEETAETAPAIANRRRSVNSLMGFPPRFVHVNPGGANIFRSANCPGGATHIGGAPPVR